MESKATAIFQARLEPASKFIIKKAADLRGISQTDYLKAVLLPFAKREIAESGKGGLVLSENEQIEFWEALNQPVKLTESQKALSQKIKEFL